MYKVILIFLNLIGIMTICISSSYAFNMRFAGSPGVLLSNAWAIMGDGIITAHTADRLKNFLEENHIPEDSTLFLNSPGGDLMGGMKLGGVIRSYGLFTSIGTLVRGQSSSASIINPFLLKIGPGGCYSACTLAFLGGVWRFNDAKSAFGVHRFHFTVPIPGKGSDSAQLISGIIVDYIRQMDVSPEMFALMSTAPETGIRLISLKQQEASGIVNNGEGPTTWELKTLSVPGRESMIYRNCSGPTDGSIARKAHGALRES
ncbi:MAG: hypothetical protein ACRDHZ_26065 [Ktedonobacteraceae bacterium]